MSALGCQELVRGHLEALGDRFSCEEKEGCLWIVSPYAYPDGDLLEIAVRELLSGEVRITDLGETLRHLADLGFDPRATPKSEYLLMDILKQHGAELDRGMIVKEVPLSEVGPAVHEVLIACLAVAHLIFLARGSRPATFAEEVSHFLAGNRVGYERRHYEVGRTGKKYTIDFLIHRERRDGLLQGLSPAAPAGAMAMVNATFRLWSDVANGRWRGTLLDDRLIQWRREDVTLLDGVSDVRRWTEREQMLHKLLTES